MATVTGNGARAMRPALSASKEALLRKRVQRGFNALEQESRIPVRRARASLPLSFAQERLWVLHQMAPASAAYNVPTALRLTGPLDTAAFNQALQAIHERHEILRSIFPAGDGLPAQVITDQKPECRLVDLQDRAGRARESAAAELLDQEARRTFDLNHGPLARYCLVRLAPDDHLLVVMMHHIITDGWSMNLFFRELEALYEGAARAKPSNLPPLPIQYGDFACWQRETFQPNSFERELSFWKSHLAGAPAEIALPTDRDLRSDHPHGEVCSIELTAQFRDRLTRYSHVHGTTEFMAMAAALAITLSRWTGQGDLVVGTVAAGRTRREVENLIGCFMNFLPIRICVTGTDTAAQLLSTVRKAVLEAYSHQDCPFDKIVEAINPTRSAHRNPIYNVALLLQNYPGGALSSDILSAQFVPMKTHAPLLDLRFIVEESNDGYSVRCEYDVTLFDCSTVEALLQFFKTNLAGLVDAPDTPVSAFALPQTLEIQAAAARARQQAQTLAIASTFTAEPVQDTLLYWLNEVQIAAKVVFAPYNQVFQQLLNPASVLNQNRSGLNVILIRLHDWVPAGQLTEITDEFIAALKAATSRGGVPWLVCFCPGVRDEALCAQESALASQLRNIPGVYNLSSFEILRLYPVSDYLDEAAERLGGIPYTGPFFSALGTAIVRIFHALNRNPRKIIALDCDQTLWEGICGEDGPESVRLDRGRKALQQFMRDQAETGMLLCLCTKNNEADVEEVFRRRSDFVLRRDQFVAARINWKPKSENLKSLARELNLGLDSFVFVDDNAMECAEVAAGCPGVVTLQLPEDPNDIPGFLDHAWVFDHLKVTEEDRKRTQLYRENRQREELRSQCVSMADFIAGLNLTIQIEDARDEQFGRIAQLTQRTNQFNFTTHRYSEAEIHQLCHSENTRVLAVIVRDRFGDYGLCGVIILRRAVGALDVDSFMLSCRVLGKGVEHTMLARLGELARAHHLDRVDLHFRPTAKNKPALDFLERIAAAFRQQSGEASVFRLPAGFAAAVRYKPDELGSTEDHTDRAVNGVRIPDAAAQSFRNCREIATRSRDPNLILQAVESWARTNRAAVATVSDYAEPRTMVERELCALWQRLLAAERVGIHDDFFALGGTSLLAVRLFAQIEKLLGRALPLVTLFQAPTVEKLARVIDERNPQAAFSSLVPIRTAGSKPLLVLVHGAGGGILWGYANLAGQMGDDQPVYAMEPRLTADADSVLTVEDMAERYLAELRGFQPAGPYYLGGYCFGGYVAYEMARRLTADGQKVALLALIDSAAPNGKYDRVPWWQPFFYLRFARNTCYWLADFVRLDRNDQIRFLRRKIGVVQRRILAKVQGAKCKAQNSPTLDSARRSAVDIEQYIDPLHFPEEELKLWQAHLCAGDGYHPKPYAGAITLLRTRGQPFLCSFDPKYGWGELARGGVDVRMIPGSHEQIFVEPDVCALAAQLSACIREAESAVL